MGSKKKPKPPSSPDQYDVALGLRLAAIRKAKRPRVPLRWIAEELGCSENQLLKYEKGENRISWSRLVRWCGSLDADVIEVIRPLVQKRPSRR